MAFQPFQTFKTWLPNAGNSATVTAVPGAPGTVPTEPAMSPPIAPVTPATPVVASGPTKPITGIVTTPAADIAQRGAHSTWEGALAALLVTGLLPLVGVHLPVGAIVVITGILTGAAAVVRSFLSHKTVQKT